MTEFGANGELVGSVDAVPTRSYTGLAPRKRFKRIGLAVFLAALAACLGVTLLGALGSGFISLFGSLFGITGLNNMDAEGFRGGISIGIMLATFNFMLFFVTVPAAAIALGLSIGRLPYRGIYKRPAYLRWGAIWGAILVGGTTFGFGFFGGVLTAFGALLSGTIIGGIAGLACGFLFHAIVRPAEQAEDIDVNVF